MEMIRKMQRFKYSLAARNRAEKEGEYAEYETERKRGEGGRERKGRNGEEKGREVKEKTRERERGKVEQRPCKSLDRVSM